MDKAFRLKNNSISYAFNLARLHQRRGKDDDNKIAEDLFKQILRVNEKEINAHLNLGLLYEKTKKNNEAINEYQKVLGLLSELSTKEKMDLTNSKDQVQKMINNVQNGISNLSQNTKNSSSEQAIEQPAQSVQSEQLPPAEASEPISALP
jgi:cytochrome c-type biogenesis protein CcmH/NrfG